MLQWRQLMKTELHTIHHFFFYITKTLQNLCGDRIRNLYIQKIYFVQEKHLLWYMIHLEKTDFILQQLMAIFLKETNWTLHYKFTMNFVQKKAKDLWKKVITPAIVLSACGLWM